MASTFLQTQNTFSNELGDLFAASAPNHTGGKGPVFAFCIFSFHFAVVLDTV